jgi:hypothetical protein
MTRFGFTAAGGAGALVLLLAASAPVRAEPASTGGGAALEPAAVETLRGALARIAAAQSFAFTAEIASDAPLSSGEKIQFSGRLQVEVRRPDGLRVVFDGEPRSSRSWFDGRTFTHFDPGGNAYATCEAPGTLEGLFPLMRERLGFTPPLSQLLHENVVEESLAGLRSGYTVGAASAGGHPATHLAFRGERADLQFWISGGDAPVIRRIVVTRPGEEGAPQYAVNFTDWDFEARLDPGEFAFSVPAGAVECDFLGPDEGGEAP